MSRTYAHQPAHAIKSPRYRSVYGRTRWPEAIITAAIASLDIIGYYGLDASEREIVDAVLGD